MTVLDFQQVTPQVSFGTARTWDTTGVSWPDISPTSGTYNWSALDSFLAINQAEGRDVIYTLGRIPAWASTQPNNSACSYGPGQCAPPDLTDWQNFITALVTHSAGRIKYWEIWNEPNESGTYSGDVPTLVKLAQSAYTIIHQLDPSAQVIAPPTTGDSGPGWFGTYLADGGATYADVLAFHGYLDGTTAESLVQVYSTYHTLMDTYNVGSLPLWDTEASGVGISDYSLRADFLAKYYVLHWSLGIPRFVWYAYDGELQWGEVWDPIDGLHPAGVAYQQVGDWLTGASMTSPCSQSIGGTWICQLARPGGYQAQVVWNSTTSAIYVPAAQFIQSWNLSGEVEPLTPGKAITVGNSPILIETGRLPDNPLARIVAISPINRAQPITRAK
jgi:hypothetical protein